MVEDNDRVTQAVLNQTIKNNTAALKEIGTTLKELDTTVRQLENRMSVAETRLDDHKDDIDAISRKADGWNIINSLGAAAAGILAWFK